MLDTWKLIVNIFIEISTLIYVFDIRYTNTKSKGTKEIDRSIFAGYSVSRGR